MIFEQKCSGVDLGNFKPEPGVHALNLHPANLVIRGHAHAKAATFAVRYPRPHDSRVSEGVDRHSRDARVAAPEGGAHAPPVDRRHALRHALVAQ